MKIAYFPEESIHVPAMAAAMAMFLCFYAPGVLEAGDGATPEAATASVAENAAQGDDCLCLVTSSAAGENPDKTVLSLVEYENEVPAETVVRNAQDDDSRCIIRINLFETQNGNLPKIAGNTFSLAGGLNHDRLPGAIFIYDGSRPAQNIIEQGTVSFEQDACEPSIFRVVYDITMIDDVKTKDTSRQSRHAGIFDVSLYASGKADALYAETAPAQ